MAMEMLMPDPQSVVMFLASLQAGMQAIQTWISVKDSRKVASRFREARDQFKVDPAIHSEAKRLQNLLPPATLSKLIAGVGQCFHHYDEIVADVLNGTRFDNELEIASTVTLQSCVCRRLQYILASNGHLPTPTLEKWWREYGCEKRLRQSGGDI